MAGTTSLHPLGSQESNMFRPFHALLPALALAMISTTAASARAGFVFSSGNNPQPGEQNILYDQGQTGMTVTGHTNQSNTLVNFGSSQTLNTPTSGAARLIAVVSSSNNTQVALTNVTISVPNQTFTDLIFNPMLNQGVGPGTGGPAT